MRLFHLCCLLPNLKQLYLYKYRSYTAATCTIGKYRPSTFILGNKTPPEDEQSNHNVPMPIIDVEGLIGKTFPKINDNGNTEGFTIVDIIDKHKKDITSSPGHLQF